MPAPASSWRCSPARLKVSVWAEPNSSTAKANSLSLVRIALSTSTTIILETSSRASIGTAANALGSARVHSLGSKTTNEVHAEPAAKRVDPADPNALAAVPIDALDDLSKMMVVDVDNAIRTSDSELALAVEEFGSAQTETFSRAVGNAKTTLAQAFNVRQILDDAVPERRTSAATCSPGWWSPPPRPIGNWTRNRRLSTNCVISSSTHPPDWTR